MTNGLSENQITQIRAKYGYNEIKKKDNGIVVKILLSQFNSPLVFILLAVAVVSLLLGEKFDTLLLLIVVLFNSALGFIQEFQAHRTLESLSSYLSNQATVVRDGKQKQIPAKELLPGDKVLLFPGDAVPADGTVLKSYDFVINEAIFTGEDRGVLKDTQRYKHLKMGSTVLGGYGEIEVTAIGSDTEFGRLSRALHTIREEDTPLQKKLHSFSRILTIAILILTAAIFILGILYGHSIIEFMRISIILAVASIPEALAVTVTVILANGMKRVKEKKGLVRKLVAMETLGVTSVICLDKTGTITTGKMAVVAKDLVDEAASYKAYIVNNFKQSSEEIALIDFVQEKKPELIEWAQSIEKVNITPFDSERKYVITETLENEEYCTYLTGAPEIILEYCSLSKREKSDIQKQITIFAENGWKLIGSAVKSDSGKLLSGFTWTGLVAIQDPIREGVKEVIQTAENSGIDVKIVTGDFPATAQRIAAQLGINVDENSMLTGSALDNINPDELQKISKDIKIYARVTPEQKMKIIDAYQKDGEVVAMTGDGVNDILALKKADIGIALSSATNVAKETADLVLIDDGFQTILSVCIEGRRTLSNIKKAISYMISDSFAESTLILLAILSNLPAPLTIMQILWGHLICDGLPDIALCFENSHRTIQSNDPRILVKKPLIDTFSFALVPILSIFIGLSSFLIFRSYYQNTNNLMLAQTMALITVALADTLYLFSFRDLRVPVFKLNPFGNIYVVLAFFYSLILALMVLYIPALQKVIGVLPIGLKDWTWILLIAVLSLVIVEISKFVKAKLQPNIEAE